MSVFEFQPEKGNHGDESNFKNAHSYLYTVPLARLGSNASTVPAIL